MSEAAEVSALSERGVAAGYARPELWCQVLEKINRLLTRVLCDTLRIGGRRAAIRVDTLGLDRSRGEG